VDETDVSQAGLEAYHAGLAPSLRSNVLRMGTDPSGLMSVGMKPPEKLVKGLRQALGCVAHGGTRNA